MSREKLLWNEDWKFLHGDWLAGRQSIFDDSGWYDVCIPHSFGIPYFMENEFYTGYGCYRKHLYVKDEWMGKRINLEFQGVFQETEVYVNGKWQETIKGDILRF